MPRYRVSGGVLRIPPNLSGGGGSVDSIDDVPGLTSALAGKAASTHTHAQADVTGLVSALSGKAASSHTHAQSDITNLVSDLAGKASSSHTHTASAITDFSEAVDDRVAALLVQGSNVTLTYNDAANTLTVAATGSSDPWTKVLLATDFTTSNATNTNVTNFNFTPSSANTLYLVEAYVFLKAATATVGPRPGIAWPTGLSYQSAFALAPNSATAFASNFWGAASTANAASTGLPTTTNFYLGRISAYFCTGATPSGNFQITLASETAATNVTMGANSLLMWRTIS